MQGQRPVRRESRAAPDTTTGGSPACQDPGTTAGGSRAGVEVAGWRETCCQIGAHVRAAEPPPVACSAAGPPARRRATPRPRCPDVALVDPAAFLRLPGTERRSPRVGGKTWLGFLSSRPARRLLKRVHLPSGFRPTRLQKHHQETRRRASPGSASSRRDAHGPREPLGCRSAVPEPRASAASAASRLLSFPALK